MDARNWCLAEELPYTQETQSLRSPGSTSHSAREWVSAQAQAMGASRDATWRAKTSGALLYTLRVEEPANQTNPPKAYHVYCPLYIWNPLSELLSRDAEANYLTSGRCLKPLGASQRLPVVPVAWGGAP